MEWPEEIGDAYLLVNYLFEGNHMLALAHPTQAQRQIVNGDEQVVRLEPVDGRWGWELEGADGDCFYVGHADDEPPVPWGDLIMADEVRLIQRRRDVLPEAYSP